MRYAIKFVVNGSTLWLGKGWGPEHKKAKAVTFLTPQGAAERLASVREIMAMPANAGLWLAAHINAAEVVETR